MQNINIMITITDETDTIKAKNDVIRETNCAQNAKIIAAIASSAL